MDDSVDQSASFMNILKLCRAGDFLIFMYLILCGFGTVGVRAGRYHPKYIIPH